MLYNTSSKEDSKVSRCRSGREKKREGEVRERRREQGNKSFSFLSSKTERSFARVTGLRLA
jgi:hypothetical protein